MGLLDGLLGQVLGGMAQGSGRNQMPDLGGLGGLGGLGSRGRGGMPGLGGAGMAAIVAIGLQLLQRNGGLGGILGRMQQQGHAREANSWVGTGENLPIEPDVLGQIFGREEVGQVAQQMGVEPQEALGGLASIFPEIVNQMTPQGRVENGSDDVVAQALEMLQQKQGRG